MRKPKASTRMKTKKTKILMNFKNTYFVTKTSKHKVALMHGMPFHKSLIAQANSVKISGYSKKAKLML